MKGFFRPVAVVIALMMLWTQSGCSQSNVPASVPDNPSSSSLPVGLSLPSVEHIPWDSTILERDIVQQRLLQQGLSIPEGAYPLLAGGVVLPNQQEDHTMRISAAVYPCTSLSGESAGADRLLLLYGLITSTNGEQDTAERVALFSYQEENIGLGNYSAGEIQFSSDWRSGILLRSENSEKCLAASPRTGDLLLLEGLPEDQTFFLWDILPAFSGWQLLLSEPEDGQQYHCALYQEESHTILPLESVPEGLPEPQAVGRQMLALFTSTGGLSVYDLGSSTPEIPVGLSSLSDPEGERSPWFLSPAVGDSQRTGGFAVFFCWLTQEERESFPWIVPSGLTWQVAWLDGETGVIHQADTGLTVRGGQLTLSPEDDVIRLSNGVLTFDYYGPMAGMGDLREYEMDLQAESPSPAIIDPGRYSLDFYDDEEALQQLEEMGYTSSLLEICQRNRCILEQLLYPEVTEIVQENKEGTRLYLSNISRIPDSNLSLAVVDNPSNGQLYGVLPTLYYGRQESLGLLEDDLLFASSQSGTSFYRLSTPPEEYAEADRSRLTVPEDEVTRFLCAFPDAARQHLVEIYYTTPPGVVYSRDNHDSNHYYHIALYDLEGNLQNSFQTVVPLSYGGNHGSVSIPQNIAVSADGRLSFTLEADSGDGQLLYWFVELSEEE